MAPRKREIGPTSADEAEELVSVKPRPDEVIAPVEPYDEDASGEPVAEAEGLADAAGEDAPEEGAPPREPPVVLVRSNAIRCPFCRESIDAKKKNWVACASCLARHHKGCWRESRKCASCGLKKHLVAPGAMSVPAPGRTGPGRTGQGRGARASAPDARRLLAHEGHIKAIAFWSCFGGALIGLLSVILLLAGSSGSAAGAAAATAGLIGFFLLALSAALFASGVALWGFVPWARWVTIFLNVAGVALALLQAMDETDGAAATLKLCGNIAWSAAAGWALTCGAARAIFDPRYQAILQRDRANKPAWYASPFFWAPWIVVVLGVGYGIANAGSGHRSYYPPHTYYQPRGYGRSF